MTKRSGLDSPTCETLRFAMMFNLKLLLCRMSFPKVKSQKLKLTSCILLVSWLEIEGIIFLLRSVPF
jgi:hypothetical protein